MHNTPIIIVPITVIITVQLLEYEAKFLSVH